MDGSINSRILIKIGGRAFDGKDGFRELAEGIKAQGQTEVILVHGGGKEISEALQKAGRPIVFKDGVRITRRADIEIVEAVLSETINRRIASRLEAAGLRCRRLSGRTNGLFLVRPLNRNGLDFGFVGKIRQVNAGVVEDVLKQGRVPVISPISSDENGQSFNVNADSAASALAVAARCTDLVYLTDVPGVRVDGKTRRFLTVEEAGRLIDAGVIAGGMVAKIESAFEAVKGNVPRVHITRWEGTATFERMLDRSSDTGTIIEK